MTEWTKAKLHKEYAPGLLLFLMNFCETNELPDYIPTGITKEEYVQSLKNAIIKNWDYIFGGINA